MPRTGGSRREGSRGHFRYFDRHGQRIRDPEKLARIEALVIPPAWTDVWISSRPNAKLQATGIDAAGRRQYLYHPDFRVQQEQAKFDKPIRFAERLPGVREAMAEHMSLAPLEPEWTCAVAVRLINLGWFRVGDPRYAKKYKTFGITLRRTHVSVRGSRVTFRFRGKHRAWVHTAVVDNELADAVPTLRALEGRGTLFRHQAEDGTLVNLTGRRLNDYIQEHIGEEFTAKDFRTWGGTLIAAVELAGRGPAETPTAARREIAAVMRSVGERLGNTAAVARSSYVSPAVVEQYLDGRTIDDFRPRHLRVVGARDVDLDHEEQAMLSLLRSWRIRRSHEEREAA